MKNVVILGSTGTIGINSLKVIDSLRDKFNVYSITCNTNVTRLKSQINKFTPKYAVITNEKIYLNFVNKNGKKIDNTKILYGFDSIDDIVSHKNVDIIVAAITGFACLKPVITSIKNDKRILAANKEILVSAGEIIISLLKKSKSLFFPLDSEHNALLQIILASGLEYKINNMKYYENKIQSITLTASGGPFIDIPTKQLKYVTSKDAIKHPTWKMGKKISVDSSTMMNKGLELIEAKLLFNINLKNINAVIHRESIVHAFVEFMDGTIISHMSDPDMKIPISYAFCYPERLRNKRRIIDRLHNIRLEKLNEDKFKCYKLARIAAEIGKNSGLILNAANEISVEYFLKDKIKFLDIPKIIEIIMERSKLIKHSSIDNLISNDLQVRQDTVNLIEEKFL